MSGSGLKVSSALVAAALLVTACAKKPNKAGECERFVKTVQQWLAEADRSATQESEPRALAAAHRNLADHYDQLVRELLTLNVESPTLVGFIGRYRALAERAARALRSGAAALDAGDFEGARRERVAFDDAAREEAPLVQQINGECQ